MQLLWMCFILCSVTANASLTGNDTKPSLRHSDWRLPRSIVPRHYRVRLLPYLKEGNFTTDGHVEILVECKDETDLIILHMADIAIVPGSLQVQDFVELRPVRIKSYAEDKKRQFLIITMRNETLTMGKFYKITMDFIGQLNDKLNGFYRSTYIENGVRKYLATTQFSPTDARRAFPCFDEPVMKARFQITLGRHQSKTATSNMPLKKTTPHESLEGYVWDEFETTLPMSTYVLAFIVSDFKGIDSPPQSNHVQFRIWSRPSAVNQTEYARHLGPKILDHFETFFNISFPLPKLDMFAIPDFAVGAMENWGLITYRETALLYDPKKSSAANRQRVAIVIAHELAHQWFGNLVTMEWWSDLWLKEGFASYLEYVGTDAVEPSLNTMLQFTVEDTQSVFAVDALATSHPMSVPVSKRNEVNEVFDSIPYSKGPAVIRMLANFLGERTFRGGLTLYLNKKKYQNAVQDDLWEAMSEQAVADAVDLPADVKTIMDSWSLLTGYPIVTIDRNYENYTAFLSQERFYLLSNVSSRDGSLWWIPLTFTKDFNSIYLTWLLGNETMLELDLPDVEADQWIVFNVEQVGYYRINYDMHNWRLISQQLRTDQQKISVLNRAQIIDDAFNIARAGQLVYGVAFDLSRYLRLESDYAPWRSALVALRYLDAMLYETQSKNAFRSYFKWLIQPVFERVGFAERHDDHHLTTINRIQILSWACKLGISECVDNATALYAKWMADPDNDEIIGANQKLVVTCAAIANGDSKEWDFAYQRYLTTNLASEKETLLKALSCSKDKATLSKLLEWTLNSTSGIRRQDTLNIMSSVASNPVGQSMVFDFVVDRWDQMVKSFPSLYVLGRLVDSITLTLNSASQLQHLQDMSEGKRGDLGTAARSIEQALERTRINVDWKNSYYETVAALMASWYEAFQGR